MDYSIIDCGPCLKEHTYWADRHKKDAMCNFVRSSLDFKSTYKENGMPICKQEGVVAQ